MQLTWVMSMVFDDNCYVRIRPDPDVPRKGRKDESGGQLSTVHHRTRAGGNEFKSRGDKDGRSRAGGSERSEEPQRDTREEQVILVLRFVATSTGDIYTNERMRRSGRRVRELSNLSENNKIG